MTGRRSPGKLTPVEYVFEYRGYRTHISRCHGKLPDGTLGNGWEIWLTTPGGMGRGSCYGVNHEGKLVNGNSYCVHRWQSVRKRSREAITDYIAKHVPRVQQQHEWWQKEHG